MKTAFKILFLLIPWLVEAQDPVFTQFYANPTLLNPAFAGSLNDTRIGIGHRAQWYGTNSTIRSTYFQGDKFIGDINSGVGINIIHQSEELAKYNYTQFNVLYSYHLQLSESWTMFPGISLGYAYKSLDYGGFLFEDQIDLFHPGPLPTSEDLNMNGSLHLFDFSAGLVFYHEVAWFGVALRHLNNPNISLIHQEEQKLSTFVSIHAGYQFHLGQTAGRNQATMGSDLFLLSNVFFQENYSRFDLGAEWKYHKISLGLTTSLTNQNYTEDSQTFNSVNPLLGIEFDQFKLGLSYDVPIAKTGPNDGSAEITLQYRFGHTYVRKRRWQVKN